LQAEHRQPEGTTERIRLGPYWLGLVACLIVLGIYIATIVLLGTETGKRSTAPPWYAWVRYPPTKTRLQAIFLVFPVIVYGGWMLFVRRIVARKMADAIVLPVAVLAVLAMNATTAMMDGGADAIWKPFGFYLMGSEFYGDVPAVRAAGVSQFLHGYVRNLYHYSIHTRTHPPGPVLVLYFVSCLFGPGPAAASWGADVITATAVVPFFLLARRLAGWQVAAVALGLYVVTPSLVLYGATSMDGVTLVVLLWAINFLLRAIDRPGILIGVVAGLAVAVGLMMSYVVVCVGALVAICAVLASREKIWAVFGCLMISVLVPALAFAAIYAGTGFNLVKCFEASRFYDHYAMRTFSVSFPRYVDISFSNLVAFLIGVGFPVVILWGRQTALSLKFRPYWTTADRFNIAAVICVLAFSFARLFTHETERIWLFFIPPALIGAACWIARADSKSNRLREWAMGLMFAQTWVFQLLLFTLW
jgi:Dolichyl-phosphate-mannose-protein mannosyltransferase